ncbi:probable G-protein coupled receptor CG31760, partial [Anastrepha obliqua]|uniref:probable G-protein coupled receptor CG31760 n=1 Tax=Anastrepha obliqua TaxID=95512 RepID=UPI00240A4105
RGQRSVRDCSTEFNLQNSISYESCEFSPHSTPSTPHPPPLDQAKDDLLKQFSLLFYPETDVNLYYTLNSDIDGDEEDNGDNSSIVNVQIEQTIAEINRLSRTSLESSETTSAKSVNSTFSIPELPSIGVSERYLPQPPSSSTSSSSMYAIRTPSPIRFQLLDSPCSDTEGIIITEMVEVHCAPAMPLIERADMKRLICEDQCNVGVNSSEDIQSQNNNTSCCMSSTLTDSKTVDLRTPIVV